jgi:hypothetical protein
MIESGPPCAGIMTIGAAASRVLSDPELRRLAVAQQLPRIASRAVGPAIASAEI